MKFTFAINGVDALEKLELEENYDIILFLTDINMPQMDGIELCSFYKICLCLSQKFLLYIFLIFKIQLQVDLRPSIFKYNILGNTRKIAKNSVSEVDWQKYFGN